MIPSSATSSEEISYDPNYAMYDDEGNVVGEFDDEGNEKLFKPEVEKPIVEETKKEEDPKIKDLAPAEKPKESELKGEPSYANHADFILKSGGYESDEIEFEDGRKVKIADMAIEDQLNLVTNEFVRMQEEFQAELEKAPAKSDLNSEEQQLVDFLRSGGTAKDLAKYINESDPENAFKSLTDDELVMESLKTSLHGASEEDIEEEFNLLKESGRLAKRAAFLRNKLGSGDIKFENISMKHKALMEDKRNNELQEEIEDTRNIISYANSVKEIAGIPVDQSVIKGLLKDLVPETPGSNSTFLNELNNPQNVLRMRFLHIHGEKIFEHIANTAMKEGIETERARAQSEINELKLQLNIKNQHLQKFQDKPIVNFTRSNKKAFSPMTEEEELF